MAISNPLPPLPSTCHIVGLVSGTSADGVDACLVEFSQPPDTPTCLSNIKFRVLASNTYPYPPSLTSRVISIGTSGSVQTVCSINFQIGRCFADAALRLLRDPDTPRVPLTAVGSHGQTVCHVPPSAESRGSTLQLGESSCIANACGVVTVSDFRCSDVAAGGQGAPLTPILDRLLLQQQHTTAATLNIGGITNICVWCPQLGGEGEVLAFDCGPGNMLLDSASRRFFNLEFDDKGRVGRSGRVNTELLRHLLGHSYLRKSPPKSTGREEFGGEFLSAVLSKSEISCLAPEDIISTLTHFTAQCITDAIQEFVFPWLQSKNSPAGETLYSVYVSGGGLHNSFLMELLREGLPEIAWVSTAALGVDPDGKEALCFALLAYLTLNGCPGNIPSVTGAARKVILGKITLPPPPIPEYSSNAVSS